MSRNKNSVVWGVPKEQFQELLDSSESIVDVLRKLGLNPYCGNHKTIHARVKAEGFNLETLKRNRTIAISKRSSLLNRFSDEEVFVAGRHFDRNDLKKRLLESGLEYKCADCGVGSCYNGKPLSLQLDHINGISNDNRKENLRFLCPNCHSQTSTYGSKRLKKQRQFETEKERWDRIEATRKFNPSKEELEILVRNNPMTKVGKMFGVSDRAIRKRCKLFNIDWHSK